MPKVIAAILLLQSGGVDSSEPPTVTAVRVDRAPVVDGRLDDPEWRLAPAVTDFRQTDPDEGAPVSEATAVRVLYDGTAVYVGARLFDSAPARIVRRLARRDASTHSDEFRVFLDSYHDRRTAFEFIVNAAGVKKDEPERRRAPQLAGPGRAHDLELGGDIGRGREICQEREIVAGPRGAAQGIWRDCG